MREIRRLVAMVLNLLDLVENDSNQSIVNQIRGLLYEIRELTKEV